MCVTQKRFHSFSRKIKLVNKILAPEGVELWQALVPLSALFLKTFLIQYCGFTLIKFRLHSHITISIMSPVFTNHPSVHMDVIHQYSLYNWIDEVSHILWFTIKFHVLSWTNVDQLWYQFAWWTIIWNQPCNHVNTVLETVVVVWVAVIWHHRPPSN